MISEEKLSEIRARLPISELIGEYVSLKKSGKSLKGLCPFHQEKTPSFYVHDERESFHCFGCGVGGDLFEFLKKIEDISFPEAVSRLAERTEVPVELDGNYSKAEQEERQTLLEINRQATWYYHCLLKKLPPEHEAWQYLNSRRLTQEDVGHFFLGYCPPQDSGLKTHLRAKGFSEAQMTQSQLWRGAHEFFRSRLLFPIFRADRKVVGFGGRQIHERDGGPKYMNSPESALFKKSELFFGLDKAKTTIRKINQCLIVEGYTDVIALHSQGFTQAIAPLGTALTQSHAKKLKRLNSQVVLLFDGDNAGQQATLKALEVLLEQAILPFHITLPPEEDPDSYLRSQGRLALENKLQEKRNLLETLIDNSSRELSTHDNPLAQRGARARELWKLIQRIPETILRHLYRRHLAEAMNLSENWLEEEFKAEPKRPKQVSPNSLKKKAPWLAEEEILLEIWLKFPRLRSKIAENLKIEDFWSKTAQNVMAKFWKVEQNSPSLSAGELFSHAPEELLEFLSPLALRSGGLEEESIAEYYLDQTILRLKEKRLRLELASVQKNTSSIDLEQQAEIQAKIKALSQLLQNQERGKERNYGQGKA